MMASGAMREAAHELISEQCQHHAVPTPAPILPIREILWDTGTPPARLRQQTMPTLPGKFHTFAPVVYYCMACEAALGDGGRYQDVRIASVGNESASGAPQT
jgi:hypothetical protein